MKAQVTNNWWTTLLNLIVLSAAVAILSACGGGGGGGGTASGVSSGEIEGFGSVIINGVKFEVEGAEVETEHGVTTTITSATQEDHLHLGMHVEVEVEFNNDGQTGTATRIVIDDEVEGEVTSASATGADVRTFTVLGQNVVAIAGVTQVYDENSLPPGPATIDDISVTDLVEVHGFPDGNGNIQASFIKIEDPADGTDDNLDEITGVITTPVAGNQFSIGSQLVDYTGVTPDGPIAQGTLVEVKGTLNGTTLEASSVHVEDGLGDNVAKVEIEGLVRDLTATTFTLNGQLVNYSNATFLGGVAADLVLGAKVEAEGPINSSGTLMATKVKFKENFRYEGTATYVAATKTFTITNPNPTPTNGDLTVIYDSNVARNDSGETLAGDTTAQFKIRARQVSGSTLIATRVEDDGGNSTRQIFEATVMAINNPELELLNDGSGGGVLLFDTSGLVDAPLINSDFEIESDDVSDPVTRTTFFATLEEGQVVKARYDSGVEDEVGIELDD